MQSELSDFARGGGPGRAPDAPGIFCAGLGAPLTRPGRCAAEWLTTGDTPVQHGRHEEF